jgi:uncharacterized protein (TIGR02444 family)
MTVFDDILDADSLWLFSQRFYQEPSVELVCLTLQDDYQVNINLLIFLVYCDDAACIPQLEPLLCSLKRSERALKRYRQMRKRVKDRLQPQHYDILLKHELVLERRQQSSLLESAEPERRIRVREERSTRLEQLGLLKCYEPEPELLYQQPLRFYLESLGVPKDLVSRYIELFRRAVLSFSLPKSKSSNPVNPAP